MYSSQEPALPLHLQAAWGLDSSQVGLVFLAAVVPTLFCAYFQFNAFEMGNFNISNSLASPLAGWYADRKGSEWIAFWPLALALPWWVIVIIQGPLALFVTSFAVESTCPVRTACPVILRIVKTSSPLA